MAAEIERKFRLAHLPPTPILHEGVRVRQGYLLTGDTELRVRRMGDVYSLAVKSAGTMAREEWEIEMPSWVFDALWAVAGRHVVEKTRYSVRHAGSILEVDVYAGPLTGLIIMECEFATEEAARTFTLPDWAEPAADVTANPAYKNKALAVNGVPDPHPPSP